MASGLPLAYSSNCIILLIVFKITTQNYFDWFHSTLFKPTDIIGSTQRMPFRYSVKATLAKPVGGH